MHLDPARLSMWIRRLDFKMGTEAFRHDVGRAKGIPVARSQRENYAEKPPQHFLQATLKVVKRISLVSSEGW